MKLDPKKWYKILTPRPVVLVSTVNGKGISNAAPFSFVMPISMDPPLICLGLYSGNDTVRNITKTGDFVVNIPSRKLLDKLWITSEDYPYGVSEIEKAKLTEKKSSKVKSPKIKECFAHFECKLYRKERAGDHMLIIGKIVEASIDDRLFKKGKYQLKKADPLMHIGGEEFGLVGKVVRAE